MRLGLKQKILILLIAIMLAPATSWATFVHSRVYGNDSLSVGAIGGTMTNDDFFIRDLGGTGNLGVGDGRDEETTWLFDFRGDSNYSAFVSDLATGGLAGARLWLTLTPKDPWVHTDFIQIDGLGPIGGCSACVAPTGYASNVFDLPLYDKRTVELDLLNFYSARDLMQVFLDNFGMVTAKYGDDAIVSQATMQLRSIPEPLSALLFATGLFGLWRLRHNR